MKKLIALVAALIVAHTAYSAEQFGTVDAFSGVAYVTDQTGKSTPVSLGLNIYEGQTIDSRSDGEVHIVTEDGGIIAVRPFTVFRVDEYKAEGNSTDKIFMSLLIGSVRSITGWIGKHDPSAYRIKTASVTIGVRGTDHETTVIDTGNVDEPGTYDHVNEGATVMKSPHGTVEVVPGKFAFAPKNKAVAPMFLAQQPRFLANRRLKIEDRIPQRKELLRGRLEQMRNERINRPKSTIDKHIKSVGDPQRAAVREHRIERAKQQQAHRGELMHRNNEEKLKPRTPGRKYRGKKKRD